MSATLHVHCGDSSAGSLRQSTVVGDVIVWCDPLIRGPVPGGLTPEQWRETRADYFVSAELSRDKEAALQFLAGMDEALERYADYSEVILWFDACLFDQTIMMRLIDWFGSRDMGDTRLSLICAGEFDGYEPFHGLGQLQPAELASLVETRHTVSPAEHDLAARAWAAFCASDPRAIERMLAEDASALPFLADALMRHLEEFPSVGNGLSRLENEILLAVVQGETSLTGIFKRVSAVAERPFSGDTMVWDCLDQMATCAQPLVSVAGPGRLHRPFWDPLADLKEWSVTATATGRSVHAGSLDAVSVNGVDRWLGGVHLKGSTPAWRWDGDSRALTREDDE